MQDRARIRPLADRHGLDFPQWRAICARIFRPQVPFLFDPCVQIGVAGVRLHVNAGPNDIRLHALHDATRERAGALQLARLVNQGLEIGGQRLVAGGLAQTPAVEQLPTQIRGVIRSRPSDEVRGGVERRRQATAKPAYRIHG